MRNKLAKASFSSLNLQPGANILYPSYVTPGIVTNLNGVGSSYHEIIKRCRFFYESDSIAGTVIDRMCDIAITPLRNKHKKYSNEVRNYYDGVARLITPVLSQIPLSYLLDGMAIPEYKVDRIMGNRLHQDLGRTRYYYPRTIWIRNAENIILKKSPMNERIVFLKIPPEDKKFIQNEGKPDRVQEYQELLTLYPEYVTAVKNGVTLFRLQCNPIFRKLTSYNDYPLPFLKNALDPLEFRRALKRMDKLTSDRVIESFRQISVGSDEFPADDDDISAAKQAIQSQSSVQDTVFNVYTNHTIEIKWVVPPMDHLFDADKYGEANADIFLAVGFPRLWAVGENERSNTSDNKIAAVGPIATLEAMRNDMLVFIRALYRDLADLNGFTHYPDPYWMPISTASISELLQYAQSFIENRTISKNTVALLYGTDYQNELEYMESEEKDNADPNQTQNNNSPAREGLQQEEEL